jgi:hypothetical protein
MDKAKWISPESLIVLDQLSKDLIGKESVAVGMTNT